MVDIIGRWYRSPACAYYSSVGNEKVATRKTKFWQPVNFDWYLYKTTMTEVKLGEEEISELSNDWKETAKDYASYLSVNASTEVRVCILISTFNDSWPFSVEHLACVLVFRWAFAHPKQTQMTAFLWKCRRINIKPKAVEFRWAKNDKLCN